jgi:CRISPR-associated endonuclease Csn1
MKKKPFILGIDVGTNSLGWSMIESIKGEPGRILDIGVNIFQRSVNDKTPTPKNVKRRDSRLARRRNQRLSRRIKKMKGFLIKNGLLPIELGRSNNPEAILNGIGDPFKLRAKALDHRLSEYELGRVLLHFAKYRGFQSNKKTVAGDLIDDPATLKYLNLNETSSSSKEEKGYLGEISAVRDKLLASGYRTLGEYLNSFPASTTKRNRSHSGGFLRTDRDMYKQELSAIWEVQKYNFKGLPKHFYESIYGIIFKQRPVTWDRNTVGNCSLERKRKRISKSRPEYQEFEYLQDINNLAYYEPYSETSIKLSSEQKELIVSKMFDKKYLNAHNQMSWAMIKKLLSLKKANHLNLEDTPKNGISSGSTYITFSKILGKKWDSFSERKKLSFYEDVKSIQKKSVLKRRLMSFYKLDEIEAIEIATNDLKSEYGNLSLKAIRKLLPFLRKGMLYSEAREAAGYTYEIKDFEPEDKLPMPTFIPNPIVMKSMYEIRKLINSIILEYGKPQVIRVEMGRDLEMNTKRYKDNESKQKKNQKFNEEARQFYKELNGIYPPRGNDAVVRYKLWKLQDERCIYSGRTISVSDLFTANCEVDHILPFSKTLNDSFFNKTICFAADNQSKGARTPIEAWGNSEKWDNISMTLDSLVSMDKMPQAKADLFRTRDADLPRDFLNSQLSDTRYIAKEALNYIRVLGTKVEITKGIVVSKMRQQWGFNSILGTVNKKTRDNHRHHAIDATVIACTTPTMYNSAVAKMGSNDSYLKIEMPYKDLKNELSCKIAEMIVFHSPNNKITGALHEETGVGYVESAGGLVSRKMLNPEFSLKNAKSIVDEEVREIVIEHIAKFGSAKEAFTEGFKLYHRDGKTLIKRVRILKTAIKPTRNKTAEDILAESKKGIIDKNGDIFKYHSFGNINHVEIIKEGDKYRGEFITTDEASRLKPDHINANKNENFMYHLVSNDTVSLPVEGTDERIFYRVQKLNRGGKSILLRELNESTIENKDKERTLAISKIKDLKKHRIGRLGIILE